MNTSPITQIAQFLQKKLPGLWSIYFFGSQIAGGALSESDLDVAVLGPDEISCLELLELAQLAASSSDFEVDLVDLRSVPTDLQAQIVSKGKRMVISTFEEVESFENFVFSSYARFNEERRFILKDIQQRGSIYER
ncbi:nucleotidyltransferase domain-containing protein [bacterium]|nr:nucleotidyltransferase domain-containing protein [bacterium]